MAVMLYLVFLAILSLVLWRMWMTGQITNFAPKNRQEIIRLIFVIILVVNFVAFLAHTGIDRASAFPGGGRLVNGSYLVFQHGIEISFTPIRYQLNYLHGVIALVIHIICSFAIWKLSSKKNEI